MTSTLKRLCLISNTPFEDNIMVGSVTSRFISSLSRPKPKKKKAAAKKKKATVKKRK